MVGTFVTHHIAAPIRLEMEKKSPMIGIRSRRLANRPNAGVIFSPTSQRKLTQLTSVRPYPLFDPSPTLDRIHGLLIEVGLMQVFGGRQTSNDGDENGCQERQGRGQGQEEIWAEDFSSANG